MGVYLPFNRADLPKPIPVRSPNAFGDPLVIERHAHEVRCTCVNDPLAMPARRPIIMPRASAAWQRAAPNVLTIFRLLLAAAFFMTLSFWRYPTDVLNSGGPKLHGPIVFYLVAAALFIVAAVTDVIDGLLARRWKVTSKFGRVMDPFADKVLVIGGFVMLASPLFHVRLEGNTHLQISGVSALMTIVILGRELLVTSLRGLLESKGFNFAASKAGKAKMLVQSVAIPTILITLGIMSAIPNTTGRWIIDITVWVTVAVTILSGWPYVMRAVQSLPLTGDDEHE